MAIPRKQGSHRLGWWLNYLYKGNSTKVLSRDVGLDGEQEGVLDGEELGVGRGERDELAELGLVLEPVALLRGEWWW
jgi:hypothetical protein